MADQVDKLIDNMLRHKQKTTIKRNWHHRLMKSTLTQILKKWKKTNLPFPRTETTSMLQLRIQKKNLTFLVQKIVSFPTTAEALILRCKISKTEFIKENSSKMNCSDKSWQFRISKTGTMMPVLSLSNLLSRSQNQSHRNLLRGTTIMQIFISLRRTTSNEEAAVWLTLVDC